MKLNETQTPLDDTLLKELSKELKEELFDVIDTIEFVKRLISPNRPRITDLSKDEEGKIIVDISNPHILEDMDYFRQAAIHFQQYKTFTRIHPNTHPNSSYSRFWKEEARRCRDGLVREDGEWIPGSYYFYLNYSPILLTSKINKSGKSGTKILDFPHVYDGDYLYYHYKDQARKEGEHVAMLKRRGVGFSYKSGSDLARAFILGESSINTNNVTCFAIANEKEYLTKDGILNKFVHHVNWCAEHTPWSRLKLKDSYNEMQWVMGYKNREGLVKGTQNSVIGVTTQGDPDKAHPYSTIVPTPEGPKRWKDINVGSKLFGTYGNITTVTETHRFKNSNIYLITLQDGRTVKASGGHEWNITRWITGWKDKKSIRMLKNVTMSTKDLYYFVNKTSQTKPYLKLQLAVDYPEQFVPIDAYTLGLMLGDGSISKSTANQSYITMLHSDLNNIKKYIPYKIRNDYWPSSPNIRNTIFIPESKNIYKQLGLYHTRAGDKFIPDIYKYNSKKVRLDIINGLLDSDGSITKDFGVIEYSTKSKKMAQDFLDIIRSLGINGKLSSRITKGTVYYRCYIYSFYDDYRFFNLPRKKELLNIKNNNKYAEHKRHFTTIKSIEKAGIEDTMCVTVDALDESYLVESYIPTKNSRGKRGPLVYWEEFGKNPYLLQSWEIARHSVEDGDISVGQLIGGGTGGTESADFKGAETLFYSPGGYHVRAIPNIYDKNAIGQTKCAFFFPAYLNRTGCYDKNGNSDVVAALLRILEERIKIKYGSTDTNALVQHKAEMCITPQDAVMRREGNIFPVVDLKDMVAEAVVDINKFTASHYVGTLKSKADGQIDWDMQQNHPVLREFPIKDDINRTGCVEIFELPKRDSEGRVPFGRYIAGVDPIDSDEGTYTVSLGSCFIFDLWTDRIVAEYSGRPPRATDFYDTALRLIRYYNAQANYENNIKGFFAYAENMNLLQYLSDTPQILRDMDLIKGAGFGNTAHPYSEYIYTPSGKKQWKDIKIGDIIFADNGQSTEVVDIPFDDFTDIYKITLFDGRIVYASNNHLWDVLKPSTRRRSTLSTKELFYKYKRLHKSGYSTHEYMIPSSSKVEFNKQDVPIDPYTLGLLLGDGSIKGTKGNTVRFTSNYYDLIEYNKFIPNTYKFTTPSDDRHCYIRIPNAELYLKKLNLNNKTSINKFIPNIYKFNTSEIRLHILKGLLDTDGYVEQGTPVFNTISKQLAEDVCFIARSLGYHSKIYLNKAGYKKGDIYIQCNDSYAIKIWTNENLFKLPRKLKKLSKNPSGKLKARMLGIPIIDIKYSHREKAKCITVNNKSECYLINDFIVTHNSKGTTASKFVNAWGRKLQADWMISPAYTLEEDEYDEEGNKIEKPQLLNLHTIRSLGYLREAIAWDSDGNFDRVSAMGMCMILREDRIKYINRNVEDKINDRFKDNFFNRLGGFNYRSKFKKKFDFRYSRGEKDYEKLI